MFVFFTSETYAKIEVLEGENTFFNPSTKEKLAFPSIDDEPSVLLSVIIPAYNEEQRRKKLFNALVKIFF